MVHGRKYWTFISEELPAICRSFFPNLSDKREETFAAGLSMGGYGALKLGLRAGDTFGAVASLSGAVDISTFFDSYTNDSLFFDIFGSKERATGSDDDLFALADKLARSGKPLPKIYMWCGTEDFLYEDNTRMRDSLQSLGYDLTYEESPGNHSWTYWDEKIQTVLRWLPLGK